MIIGRGKKQFLKYTVNVNLQVSCSGLDYTQLLKGMIFQFLTLNPLLMLYLFSRKSHLPAVFSIPGAMVFKKRQLFLEV